VTRNAAAALPLLLLALSGCCGTSGPPPPVPTHLQAAVDKHDALAIADALETLIGDGKDTEADRQLAYDHVKRREEPTAAYAYARAMVAGRLVQTKGLTAALLVREMESWAQKSLALDPTFREGAAVRMLGTLYVLAPASLLANGDSEKGLSMLEGLVKAHPEALENHLRYAEALIALGDPAPATESLCRAVVGKSKLRKDEQSLVDKLVQDAGSPACPPAAP
jgi:hypothetical protein